MLANISSSNCSTFKVVLVDGDATRNMRNNFLLLEEINKNTI